MRKNRELGVNGQVGAAAVQMIFRMQQGKGIQPVSQGRPKDSMVFHVASDFTAVTLRKARSLKRRGSIHWSIVYMEWNKSFNSQWVVCVIMLVTSGPKKRRGAVPSSALHAQTRTRNYLRGRTERTEALNRIVKNDGFGLVS